ncbi:hypothetical protein Droror1_Dr00005271 [Drosera rotundifolia]
METTSNISGTATGDAGGGGVSSSGVVIRKSGGLVGGERVGGGGGIMLMKFENPFTLKVGQVFTGFGVGCGLGIGVGRPINLGAIPVLNQVMSAASGATHAFSGVGRHVNQSLKKLGAKNIEAGIGCGVGFGHGFGVGLALKPGVVNQVQSYALQALSQLMVKFGVAPNISLGQNVLPTSLQSGIGAISQPSIQNQLANMTELGSTTPFTTSSDQLVEGNSSMISAFQNLGIQGAPSQSSFGGRSEKLINSFLQNPELKENKVDKLQSENRMLHVVLKHQLVIEQLLEENENLRKVLVEDLKIPPSKLVSGHNRSRLSACEDCFECRRKQRKG